MAAGMIEQSIISKLLDGGSLDELHASNVTSEMFLTCKDEISFILRHTEQYKQLPDKLDVDGSGRDRTVLCKGESCELCRAGNKPSLRMFIQLVNLDEKDKEKQVQLWERGLTDIKQMIGLTSEYGDLTKRNIKIVRSGSKGSLKTTYQYFPKDPSEMEVPEAQKLVGSLILDLDKEDQIKAIEGRLQLSKGGNNADNEGSSRGGRSAANRVF